jgi:hypothetical protein
VSESVLPDAEYLHEEATLADVLTWTVIPALPGTAIEWKAAWCEDGEVPVHAWLVCIDVIGRRYNTVDTSCVIGEPMILAADGRLQPARYADLEGEPGEVLEP